MMLLAKHVRSLTSAPRRRGQGGFTLMEVLLSSLISSMIALPLLAWIIVAFRSQHRIERTTERTHVVTAVNQFFPRDVASSSGVRHIGGANPAPGNDGAFDCSDAAPTDRVAVSLSNYDSTKLIVYVAVEAGEGRSNLVRRTCAPGGPTDESDDIATNVPVDAADLLSSKSSASPARPSDNDVRVDLYVDLGEGALIEASGARRIGEDPHA